MFSGQQQVSFTQYVQQHGQPLPMGNWTEDARGSLPAAYGQQFEFTIASGGQAVVLRATSYLQRGSYGAAFTVRTVQAGGALGETWCAKFFTVRDADAVKEFDRLEQIHQRGGGGGGAVDERLGHVVQVATVWREPLSANPAHPGPQGMVLMEFAALGEPLDYLGVAPYGLQEPVLRRLLLHVVAGVSWLHEKDVFHRDLKPENLVMGVDGKLKLCDFGGVKVLDPAMSNEQKTSVGVGSKMFNAPELQTGNYSKNVDSWSIGVVALVLRTCKIPEQVSRATLPAYRGHAVWHGAAQVSLGQTVDTALAHHLASGVWPGCEPSAELQDLLKQLFVPKERRPQVSQLREHPWFSGHAANDCEFAQWLVTRNAAKVRTAISGSAGALMMEQSPRFYGALCGALVANQGGSIEQLLRMLAFDATLTTTMLREGLDQLADLGEVSEDVCAEWGLSQSQKNFLAAAALGAGKGGVGESAWMQHDSDGDAQMSG